MSILTARITREGYAFRFRPEGVPLQLLYSIFRLALSRVFFEVDAKPPPIQLPPEAGHPEVEVLAVAWSRLHALPGFREPLVSLGQEVAVRLKDRAARDVDARAVEALEAMAEHGPVGLAENGGLHLDLEIGANAEQVAVERRVVQRAESQAVRHHGLAARVAIGQDVGGLEQLLVA